MELTVVGKALAEVKIQKGIFQGDVILPLLIVKAMMLLNYLGATIFTKWQEKIHHLMYMDDIKLFAKNEKEVEIMIQTKRIYSQDKGMEFGMLIMKSGKNK